MNLMSESLPFGRGQEAPRRAFVGWLAAALVALLALPVPASAQSVRSGTLLVASPQLTDPNFARSVVLVVRHESEGSIGIVLNRPTNLEPKTVFPQLAERVGGYSGRLFRGGPVSPTQLLFLVRGLAAATVSGPEVLDKVFLSIDEESLADMTRLAEGTAELRLYAGHAAWAPGQLDAEVRAGGWQLVTGTADLVFHEQPDELWTELEGRAASGAEVVAEQRGER
jgi:putative transcriptional regulator